MKEFKTKDIKLAAFLLSLIPGSEFSVPQSSDSSKKEISISFEIKFSGLAHESVQEFINHEAKVDLYTYNNALNKLRDVIKGGIR